MKSVLVSKCVGHFTTEDRHCYSFDFKGLFKGHEIAKVSAWSNSDLGLKFASSYALDIPSEYVIFGDELVFTLDKFLEV